MAAKYCPECHKRMRSSFPHHHTRAELIAYRLEEINHNLKYARTDDPDYHDLWRECAALITEWWRLPASEISPEAASASPTRDFLFTRCSNLNTVKTTPQLPEGQALRRQIAKVYGLQQTA